MVFPVLFCFIISPTLEIIRFYMKNTAESVVGRVAVAFFLLDFIP